MARCAPEKFLIVEDNVLEALNIQAILRGEGRRVIGVAHNAAEAMALALIEAPDVALVDINLGGMREGVEVADQLSTRFGAKILFVSGYFDEFGSAADHIKGAIGFIIKPFSREQLQMALRFCLPADRDPTVLELSA